MVVGESQCPEPWIELPAVPGGAGRTIKVESDRAMTIEVGEGAIANEGPVGGRKYFALYRLCKVGRGGLSKLGEADMIPDPIFVQVSGASPKDPLCTIKKL